MITLQDKLEGVAIESGSVKCCKLDNPGAKLQDTLLPCIPWKQQLQKFFDRTIQQDSPFLFFTGILICGDLKGRWGRKDASKLGSSMTLDGILLLAAFHQPSNPELAKELEANSRSTERRARVRVCCKKGIPHGVFPILVCRIATEYLRRLQTGRDLRGQVPLLESCPREKA